MNKVGLYQYKTHTYTNTHTRAQKKIQIEKHIGITTQTLITHINPLITS